LGQGVALQRGTFFVMRQRKYPKKTQGLFEHQRVTHVLDLYKVSFFWLLFLDKQEK